MDYLTNHYKNLCEQLQEKLNILEDELKEYYYPAWKAAQERNARKENSGGFPEKIPGNSPREFPEKFPVKIPGKVRGDIPKGGLIEPPPYIPGEGFKPKSIDFPGEFSVKIPGKVRKDIPKGGLIEPPPYIPGDGSKPKLINPFLPKKPKSEADDLLDMRRKAAEEGGIPDDMVNEPLPQGVNKSDDESLKKGTFFDKDKSKTYVPTETKPFR